MNLQLIYGTSHVRPIYKSPTFVQYMARSLFPSFPAVSLALASRPGALHLVLRSHGRDGLLVPALRVRPSRRSPPPPLAPAWPAWPSASAHWSRSLVLNALLALALFLALPSVRATSYPSLSPQGARREPCRPLCGAAISFWPTSRSRRRGSGLSGRTSLYMDTLGR